MIHLRTLGPLDLRGPEGRELRSIVAQPKRIALLAYLALASPRGPHRRDTLLALFWPEHDTEHARNSLNQSVHVLRRTLGSDVLVSRDETLSLDPEGIWCDALAFENWLEARQLTAALELYRGDLL
jgi:DNA-binding SARP family transcriptional activator